MNHCFKSSSVQKNACDQWRHMIGSHEWCYITWDPCERVFLKAGEKKLKTVSTCTPSSNHCFTHVYRSIFAKLYLYHSHKPKLQPALCYRDILLLSPISPLDVAETELWMNEVVQYWCISSFGHHKLHPKPSSCCLTPTLRNTYCQQHVTAAPLTLSKECSSVLNELCF